MTSYDWPTTRNHAINAFNGELPQPQTEQAIIDTFERRPRTVHNAITAIAAELAAGKPIRSAWAILRTRVEDQGPLTDITATDETDRDQKIRNAETWIRNAGNQYPDPGDIEDHLLGDRRQHPLHTPTLEWLLDFQKTIAPGNFAAKLLEAAIERTRTDGPQQIPGSNTGPLRTWANDDQLRTRLLQLWTEQRPQGEQAEHESIAYQEQLHQQHVEAHRRRAERLAATTEPEPALATATYDWPDEP